MVSNLTFTLYTCLEDLLKYREPKRADSSLTVLNYIIIITAT